MMKVVELVADEHEEEEDGVAAGERKPRVPGGVRGLGSGGSEAGEWASSY